MKNKSKISTIVLTIVCFIGLSALLYPTIANFWNENYATKIVTEYVHTLQGLSDEEYQKYWDEAVAYNQALSKADDRYEFYEDHYNEYMKCLDPNNTSVFGYIEIPKIDVSLPLYHTTSTNVLLNAIGHLEWTSLPVGGPDTHCCVSGHRGLASAKLFTNLDMLREGDTFSLNILNEVLTYEVDQIRTVLPSDMSYLGIEEGKDYCTLITCTPYGINTHRLLVRGHRIENKTYGIRVISEAVLIDPLIVAIIFAVPILLALLLLVLLDSPVKPEDKSGEKTAEEEDAEWIEEFMNKLSEEDKQ